MLIHTSDYLIAVSAEESEVQAAKTEAGRSRDGLTMSGASGSRGIDGGVEPHLLLLLDKLDLFFDDCNAIRFGGLTLLRALNIHEPASIREAARLVDRDKKTSMTNSAGSLLTALSSSSR
jgi:hypothetical protein